MYIEVKHETGETSRYPVSAGATVTVDHPAPPELNIVNQRHAFAIDGVTSIELVDGDVPAEDVAADVEDLQAQVELGTVEAKIASREKLTVAEVAVAERHVVYVPDELRPDVTPAEQVDARTAVVDALTAVAGIQNATSKEHELELVEAAKKAVEVAREQLPDDPDLAAAQQALATYEAENAAPPAADVEAKTDPEVEPAENKEA